MSLTSNKLLRYELEIVRLCIHSRVADGHDNDLNCAIDDGAFFLAGRFSH